jgi:hypothetical protein
MFDFFSSKPATTTPQNPTTVGGSGNALHALIESSTDPLVLTEPDWEK